MMEKPSNRIEFIDLAKGICIFLVVLGHCYNKNSIPGFEIVRMPLYFILSGLFFKTYTGKLDFTLRKINKILIPFIFFLITGIIADIIFGYLSGNTENIADLKAIFWSEGDLFNGPIWFLAALFWSNLYSLIVFRTITNNIIQVTAVITLGFIGCLLGRESINLPLYMTPGLTGLPFFAFGYILRKTTVLQSNKYDKYSYLFIIIFYLFSLGLSRIGDLEFIMVTNKIGNPYIIYPLGIISSLTLLLICKQIKRLPLFSYIGKYSIIILCTHYIFLKIFIKLKPELRNSTELLFFLVMCSSILSIPLLKKTIPFFVAQSDILNVSKILSYRTKKKNELTTSKI